MLKYFKENDLVQFIDRTDCDWKEAIRLSCHKLLEHDYIGEDYVEGIIDCVEKYGPYIVILPHVAMPHASPVEFKINKSGIAFTKFKEPIQFPENNHVKEANLFFTVSAKDATEHLNNIVNLMELLSGESVIETLMKTDNMMDFEKLL